MKRGSRPAGGEREADRVLGVRLGRFVEAEADRGRLRGGRLRPSDGRRRRRTATRLHGMSAWHPAAGPRPASTEYPRCTATPQRRRRHASVCDASASTRRGFVSAPGANRRDGERSRRGAAQDVASLDVERGGGGDAAHGEGSHALTPELSATRSSGACDFLGRQAPLSIDRCESSAVVCDRAAPTLLLSPSATGQPAGSPPRPALDECIRGGAAEALSSTRRRRALSTPRAVAARRRASTTPPRRRRDPRSTTYAALRRPTLDAASRRGGGPRSTALRQLRPPLSVA